AADDVADELLRVDPSQRERLLADPVNVSAPVRQAMAAKGSRLAMMHQYGAAQSAFELVLAAARAAQDRQNEGEALQNIANALYFQRELLKAREYYQQRLDLAREMHDDDATAASLLGVATTAY